MRINEMKRERERAKEKYYFHPFVWFDSFTVEVDESVVRTEWVRQRVNCGMRTRRMNESTNTKIGLDFRTTFGQM